MQIRPQSQLIRDEIEAGAEMHLFMKEGDNEYAVLSGLSGPSTLSHKVLVVTLADDEEFTLLEEFSESVFDCLSSVGRFVTDEYRGS